MTADPYIDCRPQLVRHQGQRLDADVITAVCVVIPARNEQARIGRCLDAVGVALTHLHRNSDRPIAVRIAVVLDSCTDHSADIVSHHGDVEAFAVNLGNVGAARDFGASTLLPRVSAHRTGTWLANTDADSSVPRDWLTYMIGEAQRGTDIVLGTVEPDEAVHHRLRQAWQARHDAREGHRHVHGANFGIRASTYDQLGGWPAVATGEDAALVRAAEAAGNVRIARTGAVPVTTSGRLAGRAPHGFADYLQQLSDEIGSPALSSATC